MAEMLKRELELLEKERAMTKRAIEGYRNQMARSLRGGMGDEIRKTVSVREPKEEPRNWFLKVIDKILARI